MTSIWKLSAPGCEFVPAEPDHDAFLRQLFVAIQRQSMGPVPLPETAMVAMYEQQYVAQTSSYKQQYPHANNLILKINGLEIGRFLVDFSDDPVHAIDIAILPDMQSKGAGTQVFEALLAAARQHGAGVSLKTLSGQRAQDLYTRLGFIVTKTEGPHVSMIWMPDQETTIL